MRATFVYLLMNERFTSQQHTFLDYSLVRDFLFSKNGTKIFDLSANGPSSTTIKATRLRASVNGTLQELPRLGGTLTMQSW